MSRAKFKGNGDKRDGKRFVALPEVVLESPGYRRAGYAARALLTDIAMQYTGHNNGKLTACAKYLTPKGWTSNNTVLRAVHELQACGLLIETRKGARPNKAAWFALSWLDLDQGTGLDIDPKHYRRGEYMTPEKPAPMTDTGARTAKATEARKVAAMAKRAAKQNASLTPSNGAVKGRIAPSNGVRPAILAPSDGAIRGTVGVPSTPLHGAYLETPSTPATAGGVALSPSLMAALNRTAAGVAS
jgi:hypothetical protein